MSLDITALFVCLDDFCNLYQEWEHHKLIDTGRERIREGKLSQSEMMLIMVLYHRSPFKNFKVFYHYGVGHMYREYFGKIPCYNRFLELEKRLFLPFSMMLYLLMGQSKKTGLYVVDSTGLKVCHNKRIPQHKVFDGIAKRGKGTMGWFFGFKLHIVINDYGELMAVQITPGNTDDRVPLDILTKGLEGTLLADKGYISQKWFDKLWKKGLHILVGIRKNMKNYLQPIYHKLLMRKRFLVETVFGVLKQDMGLEHSRHRCAENAFIHILSCLVAYCLKGRKPAMKWPKKMEKLPDYT